MEYNRVQLSGGRDSNGNNQNDIGVVLRQNGQQPEASEELVMISTQLSLRAVNEHLRNQGKPMLRISEKTMLRQLREDGMLRDANGNILAPRDEATIRAQVSINGSRVTRRGFVMRRSDLMER